jgi:erythromycin esterase
MELMRGCIFQVWHTEEVLALFEYVRETQRTARPLVLTGFDVQSSTSADSARSALLRRVVGTADSAYARRVYATDSAFFAASGSGAGAGYATRERDRLVAFYDSLAAWLRPRESRLTALFPDDPTAPVLARQTAVSMSHFVRQLAAGMGEAGIEVRDRGMADNLDFVLDELHPGKKVMVWAHNFHIQHGGFGSPAAVSDTAGVQRTMGTYVAERRRPELYTIGLFMYRGSAAMNNRVVYPVTRAAPNSLEAILHRAPWRYAFLDLSRAVPGPGTAWMTRRIPAKEWGTAPQMIVPREEYDGILFIDTTWPPQYVR